MAETRPELRDKSQPAPLRRVLEERKKKKKKLHLGFRVFYLAKRFNTSPTVLSLEALSVNDTVSLNSIILAVVLFRYSEL